MILIRVSRLSKHFDVYWQRYACNRCLGQIGTGQTQAQWKAFEGELEAFQAAIRKSGGPFLMGSEVSLVS